MKEITAAEFIHSPFSLIGNEWMLVSAKQEGRTNSMTASWGGLGVMWNKNVVFTVIRDSRFTKQFVDYADTFSISFFDHEKHQKMFQYMGSTSGREEDKIMKSGLSLLLDGETPYFEEAACTMICRKMCCSPIKPEDFLIESIDQSFYQDKDYHNLYIGEILKIMSN